MYKAVLGMMFTDALSEMYHASAIRETKEGKAIKIADRYLQKFWDGQIPLEKDALLESLDQAVNDFNMLAVKAHDYRPPQSLVAFIDSGQEFASQCDE